MVCSAQNLEDLLGLGAALRAQPAQLVRVQALACLMEGLLEARCARALGRQPLAPAGGVNWA